MNYISRKIATFEVRALSLLRNRVPRLVIPLACVIDYYGAVYQVFTPGMLSLETLVYGSQSDGLLFKDDDEDALVIVK